MPPKSYAGSAVLDPATTTHGGNVGVMEQPEVNKAPEKPEKEDTGDKRLSMILSAAVYDDLNSLARQRRSTMTEIVRMGVGLLKIVISETRKGNKIVVADADGKTVKELVLPG